MLKRFYIDLKKYFPYSLVSAKSQLKAEVANSYLNWLWWILDPLCFMFIYTFIFGYVFKAKEPYFPVFIFIGLSMWDFFNRMMTGSVKIIKNNKAIVSKVYLPKYILILVKIWVNGFKMLVSFGIVAFMIAAWRIPLTWNVFYFFPVMALLLLFSFGCSAHLLHYGVFVEDLSNVVSIVLRMLFYLTGIFYNIVTRMPEPYGQWLIRYNPVAFFLESMRNALLYGKAPHRKLMLVWFIVSLILSGLGIRKIYENENSYVKVI
ncbi:polysaccharide ABC transporter [Clostridiaceae bacterium]|nr:polysaccharide ABC transporter [Clostridiaceae bacterium]